MNEIQNDQMEQNHRSLRSIEKCYIRFINTTNRTVDIMWVNFMGMYVRYRILGKGDFIDVNTFKTHPWIAKDFTTKDVLHIDGDYFYHPKTSREIIQERFPERYIPENHEARVRAYIQLPVYSLRYACILTVRNRIQNEKDIDELLLPGHISDDLKRAIAKRNRECALVEVISRDI